MTKTSSIVFTFCVCMMLALMSMAQDKAVRKTAINIPFLRSEADQWSFQCQMNSTITVYMQRVEMRAEKFLSSRYKFDKGAKMPNYQLPLDAEVATQRWRRGRGTLHMENGWVHNINKINLSGEYDMVYGKSGLEFTSTINLLEHMKFLYDVKVSQDGKDYNGTAVINVRDVRYALKTALNNKTGGMRLLELRRECTSEPVVEVDGDELRPLKDSINKAIEDIFKGPIFEEVEIVLRTVLEESLRKVSIQELLPKVEYNKNYIQEKVDIKKPKLCGPDDASKHKTNEDDSIPVEIIAELPFLRNTAEVWAFRKQMNDKIEEFMTHMSAAASKHLAERKLLRAKLADASSLVSVLDKTSTKRYAQLQLSNGWITSSYTFASSLVRLVGFSNKTASFSAHVRLLDPIEFEQDFKSTFLRDTYQGVIKGSIKSMDYVLTFTVDLENPTLTLANSTIDCVGEIAVEVTGFDTKESWFSSAIEKDVLEDFHNSILIEIHKIVSGAFDYVTSTTDAKEYIPEWNYARNYRWDLEFRISELDEDEVETCEEGLVVTAVERSNRFTKMIDHDGTFKEPEPETKEGYYTRISGIKNIGIRYTSTKTQSWYLDNAMRKKMNEYIYHILEETKKVIVSQDLGIAKMPDHSKSLSTKGNQMLKIDNCWVKGISSVEKSGVDILEYDQRKLSLTMNMLVYKDLQFEGDYAVISTQNHRNEGIITAKIQSIIILLGIEIDYLKNKKSTVDYLKLECFGSERLDVKFSPKLDDSLERLASSIVVDYLKEKVVEDVIQVLRRALEDAVLKTDTALFIPEWDYDRDYTSEIIQGIKQNRFQTDMSFCDSTEPRNPSINLLYPNEETLDFSDFLPEIKTEALRRSFLRQIRVLMADGVNSMWRTLLVPLNRFNPPKFLESGSVFELKDEKGYTQRYSIIFNNVGCEGITSALTSDEIDFAYGKDDIIIMLYKQRWEKLKLNYNFLLSDNNNTAHTGSVEALAEDLEYLIKTRFFVRKSAFSVDEFFLHCIRNLTVSVKGLSPDWDWILDSIKEQWTDLFTSSVLPEIKELLFILYGYAARDIDTKLYTYAWTYHEELYNIAAEDEMDGNVVTCKDSKYNENNETSLIRGNIPFIASEAEWWSFSSQMKARVKLYMEKIMDAAKEFIREHALRESSIPDLHNKVTREFRGGAQVYNVSLTRGTAENLMGMKFLNNTNLEFGDGLLITSYITFKNNVKLNYDISAIKDGDFAGEKIQAEAKALTYKMIVRLNFENKTARMTDFRFYCMSNLDIVITVPNEENKWITTPIRNIFRDDLRSLLQRDIKKIMHLSFNYGVITVDASRHIIPWNYRKDYRTKKIFNEEQRKKDSNICTSKLR